MDKNYNTATLEFDLGALYHNASYLMKESGNVIATVKNNAYNFGLEKAVSTFYKANIRCFATTSLEEAVEIRKILNKIQNNHMTLGNKNLVHEKNYPSESMNDLTEDILIFLLNPCTDFDTLRLYNISCSIANYDWLVENSNSMFGIDWHLEWAGFMRRSGCRSEDEFLKCLEYAKDNDINIEGIWTHFAWADEFDEDNMYEKEKKSWLEIQQKASVKYKFKYIHAQNSASFCRDNKLQGHTHIRVGILLYGCPGYEGWKDSDKIKHCIDLYASVITVKNLNKGESIGYCSSFTANEKTKIAVINIGYGDGLLRKRVLGHDVFINNKRYKLVSMMMSHTVCIVDDEVGVGDKAVFYSSKIPIYEYTYKGVGANSEQISPLNHNSLHIVYKEVQY